MTALRAAVAAALVLAACSSPAAERPTPATPSATASPSPTSPSPSPTSPWPSPTATASAPASTAPAEDQPTLWFPPDAPFASTTSPVVDHPVRERMVGVSWRKGCPVPLEQLRYLTLSHVDRDGAVRTGELVVHVDVVDDVLTAMRRLYELGFPITQMRLVDDFGADDDASMRADNTSAFNCRTVAGTTRWSSHAHGRAVDINPLRNPYVRGDRVDPPEGAAFADRTDRRPGMLHAGGPAVTAWTDLGWDWGGSWSSGQDYQHVSATGG